MLKHPQELLQNLIDPYTLGLEPAKSLLIYAQIREGRLPLDPECPKTPR